MLIVQFKSIPITHGMSTSSSRRIYLFTLAIQKKVHPRNIGSVAMFTISLPLKVLIIWSLFLEPCTVSEFEVTSEQISATIGQLKSFPGRPQGEIEPLR